MKKIIIYCKELCQRYESIKEASIKLGISENDILDCLNGKYETAGQYHFQREEYETNYMIEDRFSELEKSNKLLIEENRYLKYLIFDIRSEIDALKFKMDSTVKQKDNALEF